MVRLSIGFPSVSFVLATTRIAAAGAVPPVDDLGLFDVEAVSDFGGETGRLTDSAVDIDRDAASATDEVVVIVADSILVPRVLPPSSVATPCLNANVSWPACVGERH